MSAFSHPTQRVTYATHPLRPLLRTNPQRDTNVQTQHTSIIAHSIVTSQASTQIAYVHSTRCMPLEPISLGTPYHDPQSPLYVHSLRTSHLSTPSTEKMTHTSQLSPTPRDYFTHKPRSILLHDHPSSPLTPNPRKPSRLLAYDQPPLTTLPADRPRAPLRRTLIRLSLLCGILLLAALGWRCESVGCKGRGGGGLVGDYEFVGGGSVVAGWGVPEGIDLSLVWERPSWGGERQGVGMGKDEGSSTLGAFGDEEQGDGNADADADAEGEVEGGLSGELVEADGWEEETRGDVVWDDEVGEFLDVKGEQEIVGDEDLDMVVGDEDLDTIAGREQQSSTESQDPALDDALPIPEPRSEEPYEVYEANAPVVLEKRNDLPPADEDETRPVPVTEPHTAYEASLIDLITTSTDDPRDPIHIEGEHPLATNTSSIPPQQQPLTTNAPAAHRDSWLNLMKWWW